MTDLMSRFRGPGHFANPNRVPQERGRVWDGEIQPTPFVGRARNKSDRVVIDDNSITVTGAEGTVIIDGSSNMFKIAATGTIQNTTADNVLNDIVATTLTGLGALAATPVHLSQVGDTNSTDGKRWVGSANMVVDVKRFVAATSGGPVTSWLIDHSAWNAAIYVGLNASNEVVVDLIASNVSGASHTTYGRYYVMQETAI